VTSGPSPSNYAGDISVTDAWALLQSEPGAQIVDVRTQAEWNYVGFPMSARWGASCILVEWQHFPAGTPNPAFVGEAAQSLGTIARDAPLLFLCRSACAHAPRRSQ